MKKSNDSYKTIGEVAKILNLTNKVSGKFITHTIRFWEKEFKQIKPKIFNGRRRYYDNQTIYLLKKIKFLLKEKGMTIKGVKKALNDEYKSVDELNKLSIRTKNIKIKIKKISKLVKNLKN